MATTDARELLLLAAERLIAERGPDVPLRDIATAARQRNNSAVQYYFGSRDGLIEAVMEHRMPALEARRLELLADHEAAGNGEDRRVLVEIMVRSLVELSDRQQATHYCRFMDQVRNHPAVSGDERLASETRVTVRIIMTRLDRSLGDVPPRLRHRRLRWMTTAMLAFLSDHERAIASGQAKPGDPRFTRELVDVLVGLLTAPASPH